MAEKSETLRVDNGPPPLAPVTLYTGKVMHARMKPVPHRFSYSVFSMLIDLDQLAAAGSSSTLFSVGRFNLGDIDAAIEAGQRMVDLGFPSMWLAVATAAEAESRQLGDALAEI